MTLGRRPSPHTTQFLRKIGTPEQHILTAAGEGDISKGFHEVLDVYRHFYNQGLRPGMPLDRVVIILPVFTGGDPRQKGWKNKSS
jgi:hypothetical protein